MRGLREFAETASNWLVVGLATERCRLAGEIYFLGDTSYVTGHGEEQSYSQAISSPGQEAPYPRGDRRAFIGDALKSGKCAGFVPASADVQRQLEDLKMKPHGKQGIIALYYPEPAAD